MVTQFPASIDNFSLKQPQEIIAAVHMNDIQESLVATQVFAKAVEELINNHIAQLEDAHDASAISVVEITGVAGIDSTNVQTTLESIVFTFDARIDALESDTSSNLTRGTS